MPLNHLYQKTRFHDKAAFTLIEIILAITLIGIIFSISAWRWADGQEKRQINQSADTIQQALFKISAYQELGYSGYLVIEPHQAQIYISENKLPSHIDLEQLIELSTAKESYALSPALISYQYDKDNSHTIWQPLIHPQTQQIQPLLWPFQENGSIEPLSLRWEITDNYLENHYHPIAKIPYESSYQFY